MARTYQGEYYILNLDAASDSNVLEWYAPQNNFTIRLRDASRYPADRVAADRKIFDNGIDSIAVPCEVAERLAEPMVPGHRLREIRAAMRAC